MKLLFLSLVSTFLFSVPTCKVKDVKSDSQPITHELFDESLKKFVDEKGFVDYAAWKDDRAQLDEYLELVSTHHANDKNWTREESLAYWINAYNAYTIDLVLQNWPLESIKDVKPNGIGFVNSVWDIDFIEIEGNKYSLNNLEHGIIRPKFEDQRIHAAVNCASVSCPVLRGEAYTAARLDEQLDEQARRWFASERNDLSDPSNPKISSVMDWYGKDFKWNDSSLEAFVEKYGEVDLPDGVDFKFLDYDWSINKQG